MSFRSRVTGLSAGQVGTVWAGVVVFVVVAVWQYEAVADRAEHYAKRPSIEALKTQAELEAAQRQMTASKTAADDAWRSARRWADTWAEFEGTRNEKQSRHASSVNEKLAVNASMRYRADSELVESLQALLRAQREADNRSVQERAQFVDHVQLGLTTLVILAFASALALTWTWFGARKVSLGAG